MKRILLTLTLTALSITLLNAQQIKGVVKDEKGKAVSDATVSLLRAKDSSVIKLEVSKAGDYAFNEVAPDSLLVSASYVGYEPVYSKTFLYAGEPVIVPALILNNSKSNLQAVTVSSRKALVEVKQDKTVLNVEGTVNSTGSDALELLRKAPGVMVDKDDQLSLNGKNGVQVYIDNRPTPLNAQDLSAYLKSLPSSQIEAIEIINNPSVNYEASGSAGIINIRLKKNKALGFNGSVNAGISASQNARWEDGFSINYRNKKINAFGTYNGSYGNTQMDFNLYRIVKDTSFDQQTKILFKKDNHNFKTGLDYTINARNIIGVTVNGSFSSSATENRSVTPIAYYPTGSVNRILAAANFNKQKNNTVNTNVNYSYKDTLGRSVTINTDYGHYSIEQNQWQPNYFFDATGKTELYHQNYRIISPTTIDIYALKADYEANFAKGSLGIGGKFGYVKTNNTFNQYNELDGKAELDKESSNFFGYKENVNAAYVKYGRMFKGLSIQAGVRAEQTNLKGDLKGYKSANSEHVEDISRFSRDYLDFFPSISVTLAPKTANQFAFAYNRRIDRPVYQDLNPFEYRINEYTLHKGNIDLRPQYTNTVSLTYTYKFKLNTTVSYSHVKDMFGQVVDTAAGMKGYLSSRNLSSQDITNLNISYPFQYKNYSLFANVNTYYSRYKANYGAGRDIHLDVWAANFYAQNSYKFGKGWTAEVSGFYTSPSIWQGTLKTSSIWSVDAGVQKQIMNGKATLKASVSDVFNTLEWSAYSNFAGQQTWASGKQESRQFKLNFIYRFGNHQVKASRQYQTGTEDENNRAQSSGGLGH